MELEYAKINKFLSTICGTSFEHEGEIYIITGYSTNISVERDKIEGDILVSANKSHNGSIVRDCFVICNPTMEKIFNFIHIKDNTTITSSCSHPKKYVNRATLKAFWVCPDCKADLGDA